MSSILPKALNFLVMTMYLTHKLEDTKDYGIFAEFYAYATVILSIMVFRLDTAFFRFGSRTDDKNKVLSTAMIPLTLLTLAVVAALFYLAPQIADLLMYPQFPQYIRWFAIILGFDAITALIFANMRLNNQPVKFLIYKVANIVATVIILLISLEVLPRFAPGVKESLDSLLGIETILDYAFMSNMLASIFVFLLLLPEYIRLKPTFDKQLFNKMLAYAAPLVLVTIAGNINQAVAVPLQKNLLGGTLDQNLAQAGIYSAAAKLAILLNLFTTAFNYAAEPFFFNNAAKEKDPTVYGKILYAFALFCGLVVIGTYGFIDILLLVIGEEYASGVIVVPVLLIAYFLLGVYYNVAIWFKLADKTHMGTIISLVGVACTIIISVLALPTIGIIGSAWATFGCYASMVTLCYILGQRHYPLQYPIGKILRIILITITAVLVIYLVRQSTAFSAGLAIATAVGCIGLYLGINYLLDRSYIQALLK